MCFSLPACLSVCPSIWLLSAGGIDAKVIKISEMHKVLPPSPKPPLVEAQAGPSHDDQRPFSWAAFPNVSHVGMPEVFDFDWVTIQ